MLRDLLLLTRAPLAATAAANVLVGVLAARAGQTSPAPLAAGPLLLLACGSAAAYMAGMALNDWVDRERDRRLHPGRPLPSGRVPAGLALALALGLLLLGAAATGGASWLAVGDPTRGLAAALALAACILGYDGVLKDARLPGAVAMAACRVVNALAGAFALALIPPATDAGPSLAPAYAALLGLHVLSLTLGSTWEEEDAPAGAVARTWLGALLAPGALLLLVVEGRLGPAALLCAVPLLGVVVAQAAQVVERGSRARGEAPTRAMLRALWLLDGALLLGLGEWVAAVGLLVAYAASRALSAALFAPAPPVRHAGASP